jgi:hypothetical protein
MNKLLKWFKTSFQLSRKGRLLKLITHSDLWLETSKVTFPMLYFSQSDILVMDTGSASAITQFIPQAEVFNYNTTLSEVYTI